MATVVGIPDRTQLGDLTQLKPGGLYDLVIQHHKARKAGPHLDLRFGNESTGLYSWAIPSAQLPLPGEKVLAIQQPVHAYSYKDFQGTISKGYGAGTVSLYKEGNILVLDARPGLLVFSIVSDRYPQRFALIKPTNDTKWKDTNWLLLNITPKDPLVYEKQSFKLLQPNQLQNWLDKHSFAQVQPKIDGAHGLLVIDDEGRLDLYSYRVSKKNAWPIVHTERVFRGRPKLNVPAWLHGTVLKGEIYGVYKTPAGEKIIPPNVLSALLNSSPFNSFNRMAKENIELRFAVFDVARYGAETLSYDVPYEKRYALAKEAISQLNHPQIHLMPYVDNRDAALELWKEIESKKHPLTSEGIVIHPKTGVPLKVKTFKEADVFIRDIMPGAGKYKNAAGGFQFSREPQGPIVGVVGTGFDDAMRFDMWENKNEYIGRRARVKYQEEFPSGALRAPVFIALHEDYPLPLEKKAGILSLDEEDPLWLQTFDKLLWYYSIKKITKTASILDLPAFEYPADISLRLQQLIGGPSPLASLLIKGTTGFLLFAGLRKLLDYFYPPKPGEERSFWRLPLLGAALFSAPALITEILPSLSQGSLFAPTPLQLAKLQSQTGMIQPHSSILSQFAKLPSQEDIAERLVDIAEKSLLKNVPQINWKKTIHETVQQQLQFLNALAQSSGVEMVDDLPADAGKIYLKKGEDVIPTDKWIKVIKQDTTLNPWEKAVLGGMIYNIHLKTGKDKISLLDLAQQTKCIGLDYFHGDAFGQVLYAVDTLPEPLQNRAITGGLFSKAAKKVASMIRDSIYWGLRNG